MYLNAGVGSGTWNDNSWVNTPPRGYLVEYPVVPEPSAAALMGVAAALLLRRRRRRSETV
jgi:hypothetical protein